MAKKEYEASTEEALQPNMTPLIDCIFQLIIFFMCSINFRTLEGKMETWLPKDIGPSAGPPPQLLETIDVKLVYDEKGESEVIYARLGEKKQFTISLKNLFEGKQDKGAEDLLKAVVALKERLLKQGKPLKDIPYTVEFSDTTPLQAVTMAVDIGKNAGLEQVRFGIADVELSKKGKVKYKY